MGEYKIRVRILEEHEYSLWDDFVCSSPQGSVFTSTDWLLASSKYHNHSLKLFGCFDGDTLIGACPIYIQNTHKICKTAMSNALLSPYGGMLLPNSESSKVRDVESKNHSIVNALIDEISKNKFDTISITNSPNLIDIRPLSRKGWKTQVLYTYSLPLLDDLLTFISKKTRNTIKKAEKNNINVDKRFDLESFWDLTLDTYNKQNMKPPFSKQYLTEMINVILKSNAGEMWVAELESGEIASAEIIVWDNKRAHRWLAASNYSLRGTGATSLLLFEIFQDLRSKGHQEINLMAGNTPQLSMFVTGFNPELIPYYRLEKTITVKGKVCLSMLNNFRRFKNKDRN